MFVVGVTGVGFDFLHVVEHLDVEPAVGVLARFDDPHLLRAVERLGAELLPFVVDSLIWGWIAVINMKC